MNAFSGMTSGPTGSKADGRIYPPTRRYIYLIEEVNRFFTYARMGFVFVFPIVVAFFSVKYALGILGIGLLSFLVGHFLQSLTYWYNSHNEMETIKEFIVPDRPLSDTEQILERLHYFENKYCIRIENMYRYLESDKIPFQDNLDWIEMVSLLNRLSLNVGKYFKDDSQKGKDK